MKHFLVIKGTEEQARLACLERKIDFVFDRVNSKFNETSGYTESKVDLLVRWFCETPLIIESGQPIGALLCYSEIKEKVIQ